MAFNKKIEKVSGVCTEYHRLATVSIDYINHNTNVELVSYINEDYRNLEKKIENTKQEIAVLIEQCEVASDRNIADALIEKIDNFNKSIAADIKKEFYIDTTFIELKGFIPTTITSIYNKLLTLEKFKDADYI